jgi:hypothetical protein
VAAAVGYAELQCIGCSARLPAPAIVVDAGSERMPSLLPISLDASVPGLDGAFESDANLTYVNLCLAMCKLPGEYPGGCPPDDASTTLCGCETNPGISSACFKAYANYIKCFGIELDVSKGCRFGDASGSGVCEYYYGVFTDCVLANPTP